MFIDFIIIVFQILLAWIVVVNEEFVRRNIITKNTGKVDSNRDQNLGIVSSIDNVFIFYSCKCFVRFRRLFKEIIEFYIRVWFL